MAASTSAMPAEQRKKRHVMGAGLKGPASGRGSAGTNTLLSTLGAVVLPLAELMMGKSPVKAMLGSYISFLLGLFAIPLVLGALETELTLRTALPTTAVQVALHTVRVATFLMLPFATLGFDETARCLPYAAAPDPSFVNRTARNKPQDRLQPSLRWIAALLYCPLLVHQLLVCPWMPVAARALVVHSVAALCCFQPLFLQPTFPRATPEDRSLVATAVRGVLVWCLVGVVIVGQWLTPVAVSFGTLLLAAGFLVGFLNRLGDRVQYRTLSRSPVACILWAGHTLVLSVTCLRGEQSFAGPGSIIADSLAGPLFSSLVCFQAVALLLLPPDAVLEPRRLPPHVKIGFDRRQLICGVMISALSSQPLLCALFTAQTLYAVIVSVATPHLKACNR